MQASKTLINMVHLNDRNKAGTRIRYSSTFGKLCLFFVLACSRNRPIGSPSPIPQPQRGKLYV